MKKLNSLPKIALAAAVATFLATAAATAKSPKRGVCWDEHIVALNASHALLMEPGISWVYNWGPDAATPDAYSESFAFMPMAWNGNFDGQRIRAWLDSHPESRYLLAFNEPNFSDQANMTPAAAASKWDEVKTIASDYGLTLVAPALNFPASAVGGRHWDPYEWYDEFFRLCPDSGIDCLAMHCYMNWYSANTWLATEYFYSDLFNPSKSCYGRYPALAAFLTDFKAARGHFPRMMLTEFCSWENDGSISGAEFQIDQMTQKVQKLEQSDLVEGYAWFMANADNGFAEYPYMSLLDHNTPDSPLSALGQVYVNMSSFDLSRHYQPGDTIDAKDYVEATTDDRQIRLRPNSETGSDLPLQVEIPPSGYPEYLIEVPSESSYTITLHASVEKDTSITLYIGNKKAQTIHIPATGTSWGDFSAEISIPSGRHRLMTYNSGNTSVVINSISLDSTSGLSLPEADIDSNEIAGIYTLDGKKICPGNIGSQHKGFYLVELTDGSFLKKIFR